MSPGMAAGYPQGDRAGRDGSCRILPPLGSDARHSGPSPWTRALSSFGVEGMAQGHDCLEAGTLGVISESGSHT